MTNATTVVAKAKQKILYDLYDLAESITHIQAGLEEPIDLTDCTGEDRSRIRHAANEDGRLGVPELERKVRELQRLLPTVPEDVREEFLKDVREDMCGDMHGKALEAAISGKPYKW